MSPARTYVTRGAAVAAMLVVGTGHGLAVSHATPSPITDDNSGKQCDQMAWPLPLPAVDGRGLDAIFNDPILICLSVHAASAPDGHNVMNDAANHPDSWQITSMTPPPGTFVPKSQTISMTVVPRG